jgi:ELWxxDGT repeat protein
MAGKRHQLGRLIRSALMVSIALWWAVSPAIAFAAGAPSSDPQYLGMLGGHMLFGASDATGPGLWRASGTAAVPAAPTLLRRMTVLAQMTFPGTPNYVVMGSRGYFVGNDGSSGVQVWSTDGTSAGTTLAANLGASGSTAGPVLLGSTGSLLFFTMTDPAGALQLYATDGTSVGTVALTALTTSRSYVGSGTLIVGNRIYFSTHDSSSGLLVGQMWVSDGTVAGTRPVTNSYGTNSIGTAAVADPQNLTRIGNSVLYLSSGLLWQIDLATDTISGVAAITGTPGFGPPSVNSPGGLIDMGGYVLFLASGTIFSSQELWRSDGTAAGTYRVAITNPGPVSTAAQLFPLFQKVGSRVLFIGSDGQFGLQLWSSDGTAANTIRLTNATEPANSPFQIAIYHATAGTNAYLSISDGASSTTWSVWHTDGTLGGTRRATGLPPVDQTEPGLTRITGDSSTVYANLKDGASGATSSLYVYHPGSDSATVAMNGMVSSQLDGFIFDSGGLYFSADAAGNGDEPWFSDGTAAGTRLLADINVPAASAGGGTSTGGGGAFSYLALLALATARVAGAVRPPSASSRARSGRRRSSAPT